MSVASLWKVACGIGVRVELLLGGRWCYYLASMKLVYNESYV